MRYGEFETQNRTTFEVEFSRDVRFFAPPFWGGAVRRRRRRRT